MLSANQFYALRVVSKAAAVPSIVCSTATIIKILRTRKKWSSTYDRIIFTHMLFSMIGTVGLCFGTYPIPAMYEPYGIQGASGNDMTCTIQGFIIQMIVVSAMYYGILALYFVLVASFGWKERQIKKVEPVLLVVPVVLGFGLAIAGLVQHVYGNAVLWCWIAPKYDIYRWILFYTPMWGVVILSFVCNIMLYRAVRLQEVKAQKWRQISTRKKSLSQQVMRQCFFYSGMQFVFLLVPTLARIVEATTGSIPFWLLVLFAFVAPSTGLISFVPYITPVYKQYRKDQKLPIWLSLWKLIHDYFLCSVKLPCIANVVSKLTVITIFSTTVETIVENENGGREHGEERTTAAASHPKEEKEPDPEFAETKETTTTTATKTTKTTRPVGVNNHDNSSNSNDIKTEIQSNQQQLLQPSDNEENPALLLSQLESNKSLINVPC